MLLPQWAHTVRSAGLASARNCDPFWAIAITKAGHSRASRCDLHLDLYIRSLYADRVARDARLCGLRAEAHDDAAGATQTVTEERTGAAVLHRRTLEEERAREGDKFFRQEYLCEFVDREGAVFSQESIDAAMQDFDPLDL